MEKFRDAVNMVNEKLAKNGEKIKEKFTYNKDKYKELN